MGLNGNARPHQGQEPFRQRMTMSLRPIAGSEAPLASIEPAFRRGHFWLP
jgi:hypothetical protein